MLRRLLHWKLNSLERELGVPVDEGRYMADHAPRATLALARARGWTEYRRKLPVEAYYVAKLVADLQEDCGTCVQIGVNLARKDGVSAELIRNVLAGQVDALPSSLRIVYRFAEQQANRVDDQHLRDEIRRFYGDEGLIELALAITSARMFTTLKRALGFARSCSRVLVEA